MQNLGGQTNSIMVFSELAYLHVLYIQMIRDQSTLDLVPRVLATLVQWRGTGNEIFTCCTSLEVWSSIYPCTPSYHPGNFRQPSTAASAWHRLQLPRRVFVANPFEQQLLVKCTRCCLSIIETECVKRAMRTV